jgi:hypothetical protein
VRRFFDSIRRASRTTTRDYRKRIRRVAILIAFAWALPAPADEQFQYGFSTIDNSAGGAVMDGYVSQELWTDTDMRWLGTQVFFELDEGVIFQGELNGSGFIAESNHSLLSTLDPSLAFDTRIGVNGEAPNVIMGGAVNLGGTPSLRFTDTIVDIAFGSGGGNIISGPLNLGTFTLSDDAAGRGLLLFSTVGSEDASYGMLSRAFVIENGVMRLTDGEAALDGRNYDRNYEYVLNENWEYVRQARPQREQPPEGPQTTNPPPVDEPPILVEPPTILPDPSSTGATDVPGGAVELGGGEDTPGEPAPDDWTDPIVIQFNQDGSPIFPWPATEIYPFGNIVMDELVTNLTDMIVFAGIDLTGLTLYATSSGEVALPLGAITGDAAEALVANGNWSVRGDNLVFTGGGGIPEPGCMSLAILTVLCASLWRKRGRESSHS